MRIKVIGKAFGMDGLGAIVASHVQNPKSKHITPAEVVKALYAEKKEKGVLQLFHRCIEKFNEETDQKRRSRLAEAAITSYEILQGHPGVSGSLERQMRPIIEASSLYRKILDKIDSSSSSSSRKIVEHVVENIDPDLWFASQRLPFAQISDLIADEAALEMISNMTKKFSDDYVRKNGFTCHEGTVTYRTKTLHGTPFDQNRVGKVNQEEVPGFESFYYAGSPINLPKRKYLFMQAPLRPHEDKEDTVRDFWDAVVVLEKSPIIVTVHDPKEKIPRHGHPQRAEYWTSNRFTPAMKLRGGWEVAKACKDEVIAVSRHTEGVKLVKRSFIATHVETGKEHKVTQFHYQGWADHCGAPDHELLETLHKEVDREFKERKIDPMSPITVHCAAGLGRTPTFAVSNYLRHRLLSKLEKGNKYDRVSFNLAKTVFECQKQRPSLLGSFQQWQSILVSLRRAYLAQMDIPSDEIRRSEKAFEDQISKRAAELLKRDIRKHQEQSH